jgi:hypothetical protein
VKASGENQMKKITEFVLKFLDIVCQGNSVGASPQGQPGAGQRKRNVDGSNLLLTKSFLDAVNWLSHCARYLPPEVTDHSCSSCQAPSCEKKFSKMTQCLGGEKNETSDEKWLKNG